MALNLSLEINGFVLTYWRIHQIVNDTVNNKTTIRLVGYKDDDIRNANINNFLKDSIRVFTFENQIDKGRDFLYIKCKEPIYDETNDPDHTNNLNPFVDAEDC